PAGVRSGSTLRWHDGSLTAPEWEHAVELAVGRITSGALRKVVLARDVFATAAEPIDPRVLLRRRGAGGGGPGRCPPRRRSRSTRGCCCGGWPPGTRTAIRSRSTA